MIPQLKLKEWWAVAFASAAVAGLYLTTECLDSLILSQLLIHHACQLLSTSFFRHSGCS